jgi:hypothetical protein
VVAAVLTNRAPSIPALQTSTATFLKLTTTMPSWLKLIEANKQAVLFQAPRGSRRQTQIKMPRCFLYRVRALWFYGVVKKLAVVQVPAWTRKEAVTTQFLSINWHKFCRTTGNAAGASNIKHLGWKRIWQRQWEISEICQFLLLTITLNYRRMISHKTNITSQNNYLPQYHITA